MVDAATSFKRSGYSDEDAATLATVATMFQNIADEQVSAGDSADFIIAQMKAFNIEASESQHIIDAVNEVSNNFAVSSSDLSKGLGIASAALSVGNNSFEELLGLMTASTEITRNANKSARGLVSVQSRLNQVVDENSSIGKNLTKWYQEHNVVLYDQQGQLLSLFDVLKQVAEIWPTLTKNEQAYYLNEQAGANQTQNLAATLQNFQVALDATTTAYQSNGSAIKENTAYMESLEAETNNVKATFQDLSNNVIDNELVKSILNLINSGLKILNTDIGVTITQFGLLTGVLTGGISIFGTLTSSLLNMVKTGSGLLTLFKTITSTSTGLIGSFTAISTSALPVAASIAGIAVTLYAVKKAADFIRETFFPTAEELSTSLVDTETQLGKNKQRLEEINSLPWADRTPEILAEKDALVKENAELEKQLELLQIQKRDWAERQENASVEVDTKSYYKVFGHSTQFQTMADAIEYVNKLYGDTPWLAQQYIKSIQEVEESAKLSGDALNNRLAKGIQEYTDKLENNVQISQEEEIAFNNILSAAKNQVDAYKLLRDTGDQLTESQLNLVEIYDQYQNSVTTAAIAEKGFTDAIILTSEQAQIAQNIYPGLANAITQVGDHYILSANSAISSANSFVTADGRIMESNKNMVQQSLDQLALLIEAYKSVYSQLAELGGANEADYAQRHTAWLTLRNLEKAQSDLQAAVDKSDRLGYVADTTLSKTPSSLTSSRTAQKIKTEIDLLKEELELLDDRAWFLEQDLPEDPSESQEELSKYKDIQNQRVEIFKNAQEKILALIQVYRDKGYSEESEQIRELKHLWYDYGNQIKDIYNDIEQASQEAADKAKEAWEKSMQDTIDRLEEQKSIYESFFSYMTDRIDEQITALEKQKEFEEQYWDDKISALEKQNDEIERQIQLEQLQDALARAKQTNVMVYKDGRFQYIQDIDEISQAQADLEAYEREEALRQEVSNLEQLKNQAIASIDQQIQYWELYKEQWSSVVDNYQKEQERLLIEQQLGISLEGNNWMTRLSNLETYVSQYEALMARLTRAQNMANMGYASGSKGNKWDILAGGNKSPWGSSSGGGSGGSSSGGSQKDFMESVGSDPDNYKDDDTSGYIPGYDPSIDYSQAYKDLKNQGASQSVLDKIEDYRDQKVDEVYGGKDPNPNWKHALGTLSAPGGLSLVGEQGPEMRVLNRGDGILPADITRNLWSWGSINPKDFSNKNSNGNTLITIDKFAPNLPNVNDGAGFVNYLKNNFGRAIIQAQGAY